MEALKIRKAVEKDGDFAYFVKKAAFREYVEKVWGWDEEEQQRLHQRRFAAQDFRVIMVAHRDVGILAVVVQPDCLQLDQLFILPEYQGKGIGRRCMALVIEEAGGLHLPMCLRVLKVNPRALAFYERIGFVRTGETDTHVLMRHDPPAGDAPVPGAASL